MSIRRAILGSGGAPTVAEGQLANIVLTSIIADDRGDLKNEPYTRVQFAIAVLEMTQIDGVCGKWNDLCADKVEGRRYFERYP
jgi:hypothetical protein